MIPISWGIKVPTFWYLTSIRTLTQILAMKILYYRSILARTTLLAAATEISSCRMNYKVAAQPYQPEAFGPIPVFVNAEKGCFLCYPDEGGYSWCRLDR